MKNEKPFPKHIAIIMDGNGRWAQQQSKDRIEGHQEGAKAVRRTIETAGEIGVQYLTLYTFSTENWKRPQAEVDALMHLLVKAIHDELPALIQHKVRLNAIGNLNDLPSTCKQALLDAIDQTAHNNGLTLTLALSYGGRQEIVQAIQKISQQVKNKQLDINSIDENIINNALYTHDLPAPDILIRTGGEQRISNFLLWQIAYTELFFLPIMWPEFTGEHLKKVIQQFQTRERRYGMTSEQIVDDKK